MTKEKDEEEVSQSARDKEIFTDFTKAIGVKFSPACLDFLTKHNIVKEIAHQRTQCVERAAAQTKPRSKLEDFDVCRLAATNKTVTLQAQAPAKVNGCDGNKCNCQLCEGVIATPASFKACSTKNEIK